MSAGGFIHGFRYTGLLYSNHTEQEICLTNLQTVLVSEAHGQMSVRYDNKNDSIFQLGIIKDG